MDKSVFKFLGVPILEWEEWDELDSMEICLYGTDFILPELKRLNGRDVSISLEGKIRLYDEDGVSVIEKYFYEFDSFMEELNKLHRLSKKS